MIKQDYLLRMIQEIITLLVNALLAIRTCLLLAFVGYILKNDLPLKLKKK